MAKIFRPFFFRAPFFFWYRFLLKQLKNLVGIPKNIGNTFGTQFKYQKYSSLAYRSDLDDHTLIFDVEGTLLRSPSLFPYFVLVAFEAGDLFRATFLLVSYPLVCLVGDRMGIQIMVMISFFGIKAESFRAGRAVLPKFLLENVGSEIIEVLSRGGKKVGVSNLPQVMVESFLREYLKVDFVVGRELKVFCGYYVGLMEPRNSKHAPEKVLEERGCSDAIGITTFNRILDHDLFSQCREIYLVTEADKRGWQKLAREKYPGALIFHDSRLAVGPTPLEGVAILMWLPYSIILAIVRIIVTLSLPHSISTPLLTFSGLRLTASLPTNSAQMSSKSEGRLYVCNHRTLLDPLYLSFVLQKKDLIAVTYSLSRLSEILAPIKTVRLTRNRDQDANMMKELVKQGDVAVCPEGTTCREPYLLRFSPLFSEICDEITPVAIDSHVSMFHGTTAGGFKWLDPVFFLMNPSPVYSLKFLQQVSPASFTSGGDEDPRFQVANHVQSQIGEALGFECTKLTRKDKYLLLAGNEGLVSNPTRR
ncbi:probable glycerol-3-phosphate acyltransferase 3 [Neltuma alba]|uniref:probable glycerol-3-phosphate acyltransferase 3 n=1 Tax=Neltuma alba TaxID=207710 RepID=UPI0010A30208|nr:probable glycerol-3-phosphate acyltransferase 3 [Prosopis alba]XP_028786111.1 probable glycerol-3-phosphate acyltransferase 3 [Prosopis alba]